MDKRAKKEEKILIVLSIQIVLIFLRTIKFMFFHKKDKKKSISFNYSIMQKRYLKKSYDFFGHLFYFIQDKIKLGE